MTTRYYASSNGQTACQDHGGMYLKSELSVRPNARRIETPLTTWRRFTVADVAWFQQECDAEVCEYCRYQRLEGT